jgi:hypothetical protein
MGGGGGRERERGRERDRGRRDTCKEREKEGLRIGGCECGCYWRSTTVVF